MRLQSRLRAIDITPHSITLGGEHAVFDPRFVMYLPDSQTLVVSDLHLEKGSAQAVRGRMVPPYDSLATLGLLEDAITHYQPRLVISLGDSFHDAEGPSRLSGQTAELLARLQSGRDWVWICGNHDPEFSTPLPGLNVNEFALGRFLFRHIPDPRHADHETIEVAGHYHPAAVLDRRGKRVRRPCFACDGHRLVMPAFGTYTGCMDIAHPAVSSLFDGHGLIAHMIGDTEVFPIPAAALLGFTKSGHATQAQGTTVGRQTGTRRSGTR
jgi:DNA ligase-associated metallophosphoesterase